MKTLSERYDADIKGILHVKSLPDQLEACENLIIECAREAHSIEDKIKDLEWDLENCRGKIADLNDYPLGVDLLKRELLEEEIKAEKGKLDEYKKELARAKLLYTDLTLRKDEETKANLFDNIRNDEEFICGLNELKKIYVQKGIKKSDSEIYDELYNYVTVKNRIKITWSNLESKRVRASQIAAKNKKTKEQNQKKKD